MAVTHAIVIGVNSAKGGVGKTTIATNLAVRASLDPSVKGKVAIIDMDPQLGSGRWGELRGRDPETFNGINDPEEEVDRLDRGGYDVIVMDGSPSSLELAEIAMSLCHLVVVPLRVSDQDIRSASATVASAKEYGANYLVVVNEARTAEDKRALELIDMLKANGEPIHPRPIRHLMQFVDAINGGRSVTEFTGEKWKKASQDIESLYAAAMKVARRERNAQLKSGGGRGRK